MQTNELYALALWFEQNIEQDPVQNHYSSLYNNLKNLIGNPSEKNLKEVENLKVSQYEKLIQRLSTIDTFGLTDTQNNILRNMDLNSIVLTESTEYLNNLLLLPQDNSYVASTLKFDIDRLTMAVSSFKAIRIHMAKVLNEQYLTTTSISETKCLTRLKFHNDAAINNVVNLKDWSKSWFTIARGFSMAVNQKPQDFEIIGADKGSLIIDLMLNIEVVKLITETLTSMAELATQLTALKMAIDGVKALKGKMDEDTYNKMLQQVTENVTKDEKEIVQKVVEHLKNEELILDQTCQNELVSAIRELTKFNQKGGSLNCIANKENENISHSLNESYKQLQNKSKLKLLEDNENEQK